MNFKYPEDLKFKKNSLYNYWRYLNIEACVHMWIKAPVYIFYNKILT